MAYSRTGLCVCMSVLWHEYECMNVPFLCLSHAPSISMNRVLERNTQTISLFVVITLSHSFARKKCAER